MPGVQIQHLGELQGLCSRISLYLGRGQQEAHMVAQIKPVQDVRDHSAGTVGQDGNTAWSLPPIAGAELVHLVAGILPEQGSELPLAGTWNMNAEHLGVPGHTVGAVLL